MKVITMIIRKYNEIINFLSFTRNQKVLRSKINMKIDVPEIIEEFPDSHPRGFIKEFKKIQLHFLILRG